MASANAIVGRVATTRSLESSRIARRRRKASKGRPFLVTMLVAGLAIGAFVAYEAYADRHVTIAFANGSQPVPSLELTFFPEQLAFGSPSPPPAIGNCRVEDASEVVVGDNLVPGHGVVRYQGEGVGTGFAYVRLGQPAPTIQLRPPRTLSGRVGEAVGFWFMGWRCAGMRPVANAEVVVMGGGEHGIDLATTRTDDEGRFTVSGYDGELEALGLRVRAPGYALVHESLFGSLDHEGERAVIALTPAPIRRGQVQLDVDLDPASLRLLARGLPGVEATVNEDGTFAFDNIPAGVEARIIVHGLPENCAQSEAAPAPMASRRSWCRRGRSSPAASWTTRCNRSPGRWSGSASSQRSARIRTATTASSARSRVAAC